MTEPQPESELRYLKACWYIGQAHGGVAVGAVAERLGVSHASASTMLARLVDRGQLERTAGRSMSLTVAGDRQALRLVRRHRLLETFLAERLHFSWDEVHDEAERLEWVVSERFEERLADHLGRPVRDPHGDPIPPADGPHIEAADLPLGELPRGVRARVCRVSDEQPDLLRYLAGQGLVIGAEIWVIEQEPFGGPLLVGSSRGQHALGARAVEAISVSVDDPATA